MKSSCEVLESVVNNAKSSIIDTMIQYIMKFGEDFNVTDYYRETFGINDDEEEGVEVLKVLDIYNNGGCYFPWTHRCQVDDDCDWYTYAFQCLYVIRENGNLYLKYYMLWNDGVLYDSDNSEPDHDLVYTLPLQVVEKLLSFIKYHYAIVLL